MAQTRQPLWRDYRAALSELEDVVLVDVDVDRTVPFHFVVRLLRARRDEVFHQVRSRGMGVGVPYPPNHLQPAFAPWYRPLPETETVAEQILSLPFHPHLGPQDVAEVVEALKAAVKAHTGAHSDPP